MLTPEEFSRIYQQGQEVTYAFVCDLYNRVQAVDERVHQLEVNASKNSQNSSKPPSTDAFRKPLPNLRRKTGKKPGGQQGHPGSTLTLRQECDATIVHSPSDCSCCGASLRDAATVRAEEAQIHDLPPLALLVTRHLREHKVCPQCRRAEAGAFPEGVRPGASYGPRLKALAVYLQHAQLLPSDRAAQLLAEVFGARVSEGSLQSFLSRAADRLAPVEEEIRSRLRAAPVLHCDETGMRVRSKLHWVHVASTERLTFYACHPKRGREAIRAMDILPQYTGTAIHDCWASYLRACASHGLCCVHLCRELKGLHEASPQRWIKRLLSFLFGLKRRRDRAKAAGRAGFSASSLALYKRVYARLLSEGQSHHPAASPSGKRGRPKQSVACNLLRRLSDYSEWVLHFASDFTVPFDNNQAERDLRMVKLRQKISGCFRSEEGAAVFCRLRGLISTLRKQGQPLLAALVQVFQGTQPLTTLLAE